MMRKVLSCVLIVVLLGIGYFAGSHHLLTPNSVLSADDCATFPQNSKTVCGRFLQYWQQNGGLAQQGLPLSDEFREVSAVNQQTYTVQYFERAVFELHPENPPPYDVLLTLLGREKFLAKYPSGAPTGSAPPSAAPPTVAQLIRGSGTKTSDVQLSAGLTFFGFRYTGESNFIVRLLGQDAKLVELPVNTIGQYSGDTALRIPSTGKYTLNVESSGDWTIDYRQPGAAELAQAGSLPLHRADRGDRRTSFFRANSGALRIAAKHSGKSNFIVRVLDSQGRLVDLVVNEIGAFDGAKTVRLPTTGVFIIVVAADGDWQIEATQ